VKLRPDVRIATVEDLTVERVRAMGLRGLLLDVDETLVDTHSTDVSSSVRSWIQTLRSANLRLAIVSNGHPRRVQTVAKTLGIPATPLLGKPFPRAFHRGLTLLELDAADVAMVGDQVFTDVLGAHWAGLRTILVTPRSSGGLPHTRLLRKLEARILAGTAIASDPEWIRPNDRESSR